MEKKLILPTEVKVCATCSFWDGERHVDEELSLVVVAEECQGECLVRETQCDALHDVRALRNCAWESLENDEPVGDSDAARTGT